MPHVRTFRLFFVCRHKSSCESVRLQWNLLQAFKGLIAHTRAVTDIQTHTQNEYYNLAIARARLKTGNSKIGRTPE